MNQGRKGKGSKVATEVVPDEFRCKRSDGKRWRCGARAVEGKSMCEKHIVQAKKRAAVGATAKPPEPKRVKNKIQPKGKLVKKPAVDVVIPPQIQQEVDTSVTETESDTETETETETYDDSATESDNPPPEYMAKPLVPPSSKHAKVTVCYTSMLSRSVMMGDSNDGTVQGLLISFKMFGYLVVQWPEHEILIWKGNADYGIKCPQKGEVEDFHRLI